MTTINTHITVIATLTPSPGKADRLQQVLSEFTKTVHYEEPDTLRYQLHRQLLHSDSPAHTPEELELDGLKEPLLVMIETYRNPAAFRHHCKTHYFATLVARLEKEQLLAKPMDIVQTHPVAGYSSLGAEILGASSQREWTAPGARK